MNYDLPLYRPPSEAGSLILQITLGCSHNKCTFCSMYKTKRFKVFSQEEIAEQISWAKAKFPNARRIFLADGNVLVLDTPKLIGIVQTLYRDFPELERVTAYAGPKDILNKSEAELQAINKAGLDMLYLGVESGSEQILANINKGVNQEEMITAGQKAKKAGFKLSCTIISGLGGVDLWQTHALETAKVINAIQPDFLAALTLLVEENTALAQKIKNKEFTLLTARQVVEELSVLIANLELDNCVFRSNHPSNYLALKGTLNEDKEKLLNLLKKAQEFGENDFRPEGWRGL